jgi:16S rRNA (guanine527-N7)-methyltransferase
MCWTGFSPASVWGNERRVFGLQFSVFGKIPLNPSAENGELEAVNSKLTYTTAPPEQLLKAGTESLGLFLEPGTLAQFLYYAGELLKWNARINLTGLKTVQEVVVKHFLDSLAVWSRVKDLDSLADIGCGAGFPGLPLKLVLPHLHLTLIEPTAKKTAFLHFVMAHLGLSDVEVRQVHLTPRLAREWGASWQGGITRATFPLARYMEIGAPLVKPGGQLLAMKGPGLDEAEWQEAAGRAARYHCRPPERHEYTLPLTGERRLLVVWEKLL